MSETGETPVVSIMVVADGDSADAGAFTLKERVSATQLRDPHLAAQLLERLRWALENAERADRGSAESAGAPWRLERSPHRPER
jgi:hypothetical protein